MKKTIVLVLIAISAIILVACGGSCAPVQTSDTTKTVVDTAKSMLSVVDTTKIDSLVKK